MPDEGVTGWDDLVLGRIDVPNEQLDDLVIVRSDGRPTYNFVSPLEDALDGITHVIRGQDHVSNTPKQLLILEAIGADLPAYAHVPLLNGPMGASSPSATARSPSRTSASRATSPRRSSTSSRYSAGATTTTPR
jgi:glutamyl/glutaminyl-tRNA synthetase